MPDPTDTLTDPAPTSAPGEPTGSPAPEQPTLLWRLKLALLQWLHRTLVAALIAGSLFIRPALFPAPIQAASITVNTLSDGIVSDANCTLREAIIAANTDSAFNGCAAGSGADTISLPAGTINLSLTSYPIRSDMTIQGQGQGSTFIDGGGQFRHFFVKSGTVLIENMTLQNGQAKGGNGGGGGAGLGGSILMYGGSVTVRNVGFANNFTTGGNGGSNGGGGLGGNGYGGGGGFSGRGGFGVRGGAGGGGFSGSGGYAGGGYGNINGYRGDYGGGGGGGGHGGSGNGSSGSHNGLGLGSNGSPGSGGPAGGGPGGLGYGGGGGGYGGYNNPGGSGGSGAFGGGGGGGAIGGGLGANGGSGGNGGFGGGGGVGAYGLQDSYSGGGGNGGNGGNGGFGGGGGNGNHGGNGGSGGNDGNGGNGGFGGFGGGGGGGGSSFNGGNGSNGSNGLGGDFGGDGGSGGASGGGGAGLGGAIFIRSGSLALENDTFNNNSASGGSGATNGEGKGGAIFVLDRLTNANSNNQDMPASPPTISACGLSFSSNSAADNGVGTAPNTGVDTEDVFGDIGSNPMAACSGGAAAEMAVLGNSVEITDGDSSPSASDHTDFGSVSPTGAITRTFTISNSGTADLTISSLSLSGAAAGDFSVSGIVTPTTVISANTTTFQVRFDPSVAGTRAATVTIVNDDSDENPYDFAIQGTGSNQAPNANAGTDQTVGVGTLVTLDGSGSSDSDSHTPLTFGWTQTGGPVVTLNSTTAVSPTFTAPGVSTVLTFSLTVTDTFGLADPTPDEVVVTVTSNPPEMAVLGNGLTIGDGDTTPSTSDHTDFGSITLGQAVTRTFTISNSGKGSLTLTGSPVVSITGPRAGDFTVVSNPTTPVAAAGTTTFQVRFSPSVTGTRSATVTIANNDSNENPYDFAIQGAGAASGGSFTAYLPLIFKNFYAASDLVIDALSAGSGGVEITIRNAGDSPITNAFWVDVYFNPNPAPPHLNQPWDTIAEAGAVWGVTKTLNPGESLILTSGGAYYFADKSSASFPAGAQVYGLVDSINFSTTYGNVQESNEGNNVFGPVVSSASSLLAPGAAAAPSLDGLPER